MTMLGLYSHFTNGKCILSFTGMSECKAVLISVTCREGWDGVAEESKKTPQKAKTAESHFFTPPSLGNDFFIKTSARVMRNRACTSLDGFFL